MVIIMKKDFDWACCTCRATRSCERVGVGLIWPREYLQILEQKGISLQDSLFSVSEVHFFLIRRGIIVLNMNLKSVHIIIT